MSTNSTPTMAERVTTICGTAVVFVTGYASVAGELTWTLTFLGLSLGFIAEMTGVVRVFLDRAAPELNRSGITIELHLSDWVSAVGSLFERDDESDEVVSEAEKSSDKSPDNSSDDDSSSGGAGSEISIGADGHAATEESSVSAAVGSSTSDERSA